MTVQVRDPVAGHPHLFRARRHGVVAGHPHPLVLLARVLARDPDVGRARSLRALLGQRGRDLRGRVAFDVLGLLAFRASRTTINTETKLRPIWIHRQFAARHPITSTSDVNFLSAPTTATVLTETG